MRRPFKRKQLKSNLRTSRRKNRNKITFDKCHPLVKKHWDPNLTLKQNYEKLGLIGKLSGQAGGTENHYEHTIQANEALVYQAIESEAVAVRSMDHDEPILLEKSDELMLEEERNIRIDPTKAVIGIKIGSCQPVKISEETEFVKLLQQAAIEPPKAPRPVSEQEYMVLMSLIEKHGENVDAMVIDKRLNKYQLSKGQINRKIKLMKVWLGI